MASAALGDLAKELVTLARNSMKSGHLEVSGDRGHTFPVIEARLECGERTGADNRYRTGEADWYSRLSHGGYWLWSSPMDTLWPV